MRTVSNNFWASHSNKRSRSASHLLRKEAYVLYLCSKDKRVDWPTRLWAYILSMYIFSPFDVIPDFLPLVGHLDDLFVAKLALNRLKKNIPYYILMEKECMDQMPIIKDSVMNLLIQTLALLIWVLIAFLFTLVFMNL